MVTRTDIADAVAHLFDGPPVPRSELLSAASAAPEGGELREVLEQLPDTEFRTLRELWAHLGWVPVA